MPKILYAEDQERYRKLVKVFLETAKFDVITVEDGEKALEYLSHNNDVDLILLDIMMPNIDGKDVCKYLRKTSDIPIIMLTALADSSNEVDGLNLGADDYISKPFSRDTLIARINCVIRRCENKRSKNYHVNGFEFFKNKGVLRIEGKEISLTPKEILLLEFFLNNKDCVFSRNQILDSVWGFDYYGNPRTVDTHVKSLRSRLGEFGQRIKTARGRGYYYQS
ncbi:MAG: response regulator transcription factor [Sphaerochaetaceae bacterium]|nr:response regulator transcription factor [Sphaerochaetaceae bacterium]